MAEIEPGFIIIRNAMLADPARRRAEATDVLIQDGVIKAVGIGIAAPPEAKVIDATRHIIHPGLINAHTPTGWKSV